MIEAKTITKEEEKALLKEWFDTVQFDQESDGIPPLADEVDDESRGNPNHDKAGKFASGHGGHGSGAIHIDDKKATDLHGRLKEPDGGFTVDARTGKDVTSGYAVALHPERSKEINISEVTPNTIQDYASSNADLLGSSENKLGGWHDPDTGQVWLDVSRVTSDKAEAIKLAKDANQIAIFDLGSGNSINTGGTGRSSYPFVFTRANPNHDKLGKFASGHSGAMAHGTDQTKWAEDVGRDMENTPLSYSGNINDPISRPLVAIAHQQKFDGLPQRGSVDDVIKAGGLEVHRGLIPHKASGTSAETIRNETLNGKYGPGKGNYGSGFYFSTSPGVAKMYANAPIATVGFNAKAVEGGATIRAALHKDAKIIDYDKIEATHKEWYMSIRDRIHWNTYETNFVIPEGKVSPILGDVMNDPGHFAAIMGYDAIRVPLKDRSTDRRNKARIKRMIGSDDLGDEIVVLNRTALVVDA